MARFWKRRKMSDGGRETRHQASGDTRDKASIKRSGAEPTRSRPTNTGSPGTVKITQVRRNGKNYVRTIFKTGGWVKTTFRRRGPHDKPGRKKSSFVKSKRAPDQSKKMFREASRKNNVFRDGSNLIKKNKRKRKEEKKKEINRLKRPENLQEFNQQVYAVGILVVVLLVIELFKAFLY
ncbi:MAG TPA: hypothetical protein VLB82_01545 [Thermodesulfobacteriota bacterium]|jgi:hypothetical protein|nr:hypothetical protein [Thermodesulfobacteriota bacterium]